MNQNDVLSLLLALAVIGGAIALRSRIAGNPHRAAGWWIGLLHGLFAVLAVHAATLAHDFPFLCAMITFTGYAAAMAASETLVLLRAKEIT